MTNGNDLVTPYAWKIGEYSNYVIIEDFVTIKESITIKNV